MFSRGVWGEGDSPGHAESRLPNEPASSTDGSVSAAAKMPFQRAQQCHDGHDAAYIDGNTRHGAAHVAAVCSSCMAENLCHAAVELFLLGNGELKAEAAGHGFNGVQHRFPQFAPSAEKLSVVHACQVELADPFLYGRHVVEQLAREEPVFG